jgi:hypothetical protein
MAMPSNEEITEQMKLETGTGKDSYLPARQLAAWKKSGVIPAIPAEQDQTQLLRMYMALKTIMGGKGEARITAVQFAGYVRTISHTTSFRRKLWVVPKANFDTLDKAELSKYFIDKSTVVEFPSFADPMDIELVDQCIPQSSLGMGVQDRELSSAECGLGLCAISFGGSPSRTPGSFLNHLLGNTNITKHNNTTTQQHTQHKQHEL